MLFVSNLDRNELKDVLVNYHYEVNQNAMDTSDIYDEETAEYLAEYLEENGIIDADNVARDLIDDLAAEVEEEIRDFDRNTIDDYNEYQEAMRGEY